MPAEKGGRGRGEGGYRGEEAVAGGMDESAGVDGPAKIHRVTNGVTVLISCSHCFGFGLWCFGFVFGLFE